MTMKREQHKYITVKFSNLGKILLGMEGGGGGRAKLRKLRGEAARKRQRERQSVTAQETVRQRKCTGEIEPFRERQAKK